MRTAGRRCNTVDKSLMYTLESTKFIVLRRAESKLSILRVSLFLVVFSTTKMNEAMEIPYSLKNGESAMFDISNSATQPFGFFYQDRVKTPRGLASVIGVKDKQLYFHVDGDAGATFWSKCKSAEDFQLRNFEKTTPEAPVVDPNEYHKLKAVTLKEGRKCQLVMQNINGPCPIIALANALLISGNMELAGYEGRSAIASDTLKTLLLQYLLVPRPLPTFQCPDKVGDKAMLTGHVSATAETLRAELAADTNAGAELLSRFYSGLNVTPVFSHVDAFEAEDDCRLFALASIRMVHGWLIPEGDPKYAALRDRSYIECASLTLDTQHADSESAQRFLADHGSQLTPFGTSELLTQLNEGDVVVLFRNNHFSTLLRQRNKLLLVVSDEGYTDRPSVVYEELTVDGNGSFYDGEVSNIPEYVLGVISQYGDTYSSADIEKAHQALMDRNQPITTSRLIEELEKAAKQKTGTVLAPAPAPPPVAEPIEFIGLSHKEREAMTQLMNMGIDTQVAKNALVQCDWSVERAVNLVFSL